jgi:hypothetical protein
MRFISTSTHGVLDYVVGVLLIVAPWLLNFASNGVETVVPVLLGIVVIIYSLFTNYERGLVHSISMKTHLWLDGILGLFLAVSPWLLNYEHIVYWPHLIVGILMMGVALMTKTVPQHMKITIS